METVYWTPDEFEAANQRDVEVPAGSGKRMKIRALSPEELIDFQARLKAEGGAKMADDDPTRLRATFAQMKVIVRTAVLQPSLSEESVGKLGRLLVPLFNEIMQFSGMDGTVQKADETFR